MNLNEMREWVQLKLAAEKLLKEFAARKGCRLGWAGDTAWTVSKEDDPKNAFRAELNWKTLTLTRPGRPPESFDVTADHYVKEKPREAEVAPDAESISPVATPAEEPTPTSNAEASTTAQPESAPSSPSAEPDLSVDVEIVDETAA